MTVWRSSEKLLLKSSFVELKQAIYLCLYHSSCTKIVLQIQLAGILTVGLAKLSHLVMTIAGFGPAFLHKANAKVTNIWLLVNRADLSTNVDVALLDFAQRT